MFEPTSSNLLKNLQSHQLKHPKAVSFRSFVFGHPPMKRAVCLFLARTLLCWNYWWILEYISRMIRQRTSLRLLLLMVLHQPLSARLLRYVLPYNSVRTNIRFRLELISFSEIRLIASQYRSSSVQRNANTWLRQARRKDTNLWTGNTYSICRTHA